MELWLFAYIVTEKLLIKSADVVGIAVAVYRGSLVKLEVCIIHKGFDVFELKGVDVAHNCHPLRFFENTA